MVAIRRRITGIGILALLLAACDAGSRLGQSVIRTDSADGLFRDFGAFCTTDAPQGCATASLQVTYVGDGTSILLLHIGNLQGTHPTDNTGGWRLSHLSFGTREREGISNGLHSFGLAGTVGSYGTPDLSYPFDPVAPFVPDTGERAPGMVLLWHNDSQTHGIVGCTQVPLDTVETSYPFRGAWQTCPSLGYNGSFFVAIRMSWELQDADKLFVVWAGPTSDGAFVNCDTRYEARCGAAPTALARSTRAASSGR